MSKRSSDYPVGKHPNSLAQLKPIAPGEARNPEGINSGGRLSKGRMRSLVDLVERYGFKDADARVILDKLVAVAKTGDLKALEMLLSLDRKLNPDIPDELEVTPQHVQQAEAALRDLATKLARMRNGGADA